MKIVIFDTETTGLLMPHAPLEKQPQIIEFGAIVVIDGEINCEYNQLINPGVPLPEIITKITGITDDDLKDAPVFKDALPYIVDCFIGADCCVAHNAAFDVDMLKNELLRIDYEDFPWPGKTVCTMKQYEPMKLTLLYSRIMGFELKQTHRALDDCRALYEILQADNFLGLNMVT